MVVDLGKAVEAAEGDAVAGVGGKVVDFGHRVEGAVAPEGVGEAEGFFDVHVVGIRRVEVGVGDAVVDGGDAGRGGVAEPGDLEGGGLSREDAEAVSGHVEGEVDEDVDGIGADQVGGLIIAQL